MVLGASVLQYIGFNNLRDHCLAAMTTETMASPQDRHFRTAYKVEELLALRDSVSESAVSLDKFPAEDAIKGTSVLSQSYSLRRSGRPRLLALS